MSTSVRDIENSNLFLYRDVGVKTNLARAVDFCQIVGPKNSVVHVREQLIELLGHRSREGRLAAGSALGKCLAEKNDETDQERLIAINERTISKIVEMLRDPTVTPTVKEACCYAAYPVASRPEVRAAIDRLLDSPNRMLRMTALACRVGQR